MKRVVLAYSGGLDTSWCIGYLQRELGAEVITVTVDCGGLDREDLEARSRQMGAVEHHHLDARETFFREIIRHLIAGNVLRGGVYPICVGAERTLQAREAATVALELDADAICHGCTAAGNDQIRFENALRALTPGLEILAPVRDLAPTREQEFADLASWGIELPTSTSRYSVNSGLWGVTIGGQETLTSEGSLPEEAWVRTRGALDRCPAAERHTLSFERGIPIALDGEMMDPVALIEGLDSLAASFGIGRGIHLGDTILGIKGRVAFEAPAAVTLITAHRELEKLVLGARQLRTKETLARDYGDWVHEGRWLDPVCRDVEAFFDSTQGKVSGDVHLLLSSGQCFVEGVESASSLMTASKARYGETTGGWTPRDAAGFARLQGLSVSLLVSREGVEA